LRTQAITGRCEFRKFDRNYRAAPQLPLWREAFFALELALLHVAPVYFGFGSPKGDGSGVVVVPGFLNGDVYLSELYAWLYRLDYKPYFSGIRVNADCPNLLIRRTLNATIDRAVSETGRKIHLIGHSLGGSLALAIASQRPDDVASVMTLGSPIRGAAVHPRIFEIAEQVRRAIRDRNGDSVLPACYTGLCTCNFVDALTRDLPESVMMTAIYTRTDAVVDWQYCITGDPASDLEVPGTHVGLAFNPSAYVMIANRLALARAGAS
jgi:pimeloyl-ACP methyl ester carboxylesterase